MRWKRILRMGSTISAFLKTQQMVDYCVVCNFESILQNNGYLKPVY